MSIFKRVKKGGIADVIRCDQKEYLVWKWHPEGVELGTGRRENALRTGSVVRVKEGEVAVFVYKQNNGMMQDYIYGPFDETIHTKNFPVLSSIIGLWYEGDTPFQAEIYFINLAKVIQIPFVVPYFEVPDSIYPEFSVPVAVRGMLTFQIADARLFVQKHQLVNFDLNDMERQIEALVERYVKNIVCNAPFQNHVSVLQLSTCLDNINMAVEDRIRGPLEDIYGIQMHSFDIQDIDLDQTSDNYARLAEITRDITTKKVLFKTDADLENYAANQRIQREETKYAMHMSTEQNNLGAFHIEKQTQVGIAGSEALGKMGENGSDRVDLGGGNSGFNPAAMMAEIAVGNVVGQSIAGTMKNSLGEDKADSLPPKIPEVRYFVAFDGKPSGPYSLSDIQAMASEGKIISSTLIWKKGMTEWACAESIKELSDAFPPSIPTAKK